MTKKGPAHIRKSQKSGCAKSDKGIRPIVVRAENGVDPDEEKELIVRVGLLKRTLSQTKPECQRPYVSRQRLLVSGLALASPPPSHHP